MARLRSLAIACIAALASASAQSAMAGPADSLTPAQTRLRAEWARLCDSLKAAGDQVIALDSGRELDTAEGFQYLAMLSGMAIERTQYYDSRTQPIIARTLDGYKKIGLDSSDNSYRMVGVEAAGVYRIHGVRGSSTYMGFQINRGGAAVGNINQREMSFDPDGSFELYLGGERQGQNWVALPEGADNVYIREIFVDWETERPSPMWIERLDRVAAPAPLDSDTMALRLRGMAAFVDRNVSMWGGYVAAARRDRTNTLPVPKATTGEGGSADNLYSGGYFLLADDEALVIESESAGALLWNVQLGNVWFQSLDYQYRQTSLNSHQAVPDADGRYRVVVAGRDPGVRNWVDTAGHAQGVIFYRWNQAKRAPAAPEVRRVKFAQVAGLLPAGTARVGPQERERLLRERYRNVARRFAL